jgi:hypothetical protein
MGTEPEAHGGQDEWLRARQAADRAGVAWKTWTSYVSRGQAPKADRRNPGTGDAEWLPATVDAWKAARPGSGRWAASREKAP